MIGMIGAYDWCVRTWLFKSINNRITPNLPIYNCICLMEELYKKTEATVKDNRR